MSERVSCRDIAAAAVTEPAPFIWREPRRALCQCGKIVLVAVVYADPKRQRGERLFIADLPEWEPRAACYLCVRYSRFDARKGDCSRCDGTGFVGEKRPTGEMLAWDVAWSDGGHLRVVGGRTSRRKGEALFRPHECSHVGASGASALTLA